MPGWRTMRLAAWLIPSEFMDVNYGEGVKRYLTERVSLLQIHRFSPADVQFDDALVSSAIVVFENRKPAADARVLLSFGGTLTHPASSVDVDFERMRAAKKWTSLSQRDAAGTSVPSRLVGRPVYDQTGACDGEQPLLHRAEGPVGRTGNPDSVRSADPAESALRDSRNYRGRRRRLAGARPATRPDRLQLERGGDRKGDGRGLPSIWRKESGRACTRAT